MAKQYITKHILHHNGKKYRAGSPVALDDADALPLLAKGHIATSVPPVVATLSSSTLSKLTVPELTDYASKRGIDIPSGSTKEQILALVDVDAKE